MNELKKQVLDKECMQGKALELGQRIGGLGSPIDSRQRVAQ